MSRARLLSAIGLTALLCLCGSAGAAPRQTSLGDLEDEVMCPICGTLLELSDSPQAQRERAFIRRLIVAGRSKPEIKQALVDEYGSGVLAQPPGSGFDLSAYLVPVVAFLAAAAALAVGAWRWRQRSPEPASDDQGGRGPSAEDEERLDADLARYDL